MNNLQSCTIAVYQHVSNRKNEQACEWEKRTFSFCHESKTINMHVTKTGLKCLCRVLWKIHNANQTNGKPWPVGGIFWNEKPPRIQTRILNFRSKPRWRVRWEERNVEGGEGAVIQEENTLSTLMMCFSWSVECCIWPQGKVYNRLLACAWNEPKLENKSYRSGLS